MNTCDELSWENYMGTEFATMFFAMILQIPIFAALLVIVDIVKDGGKFSDALNLILVKIVEHTAYVIAHYKRRASLKCTHFIPTEKTHSSYCRGDSYHGIPASNEYWPTSSRR